MDDWAFTQDDLRLMTSLGISESQVRNQIALFQKASGYLRLLRPCLPGDGLEQITADEENSLILQQEEGAREGRFMKFVPASGAATRMFQGLLPFYLDRASLDSNNSRPELSGTGPEEAELQKFFSGLRRFAFWEELQESMAREGLDITAPAKKNHFWQILDCLLTERGLNYLNRPKGLHHFHAYPGHSRTAMEEHLVEAIQSISDRQGRCRLHVTTSPEHEDTFKDFFKTLQPIYENRYGCRLVISISFQNHSTDTLAVDLNNQPFRDDSDHLFFRPGGHGALLQNLNDLQGDLIYIKNIDNILPDRMKAQTILWKKILGGYLIKMQDRIHQYLRKLTEGMETENFISEVRGFCRDRLSIIEPSDIKKRTRWEQKKWLLQLLNRPIRVCGMVKNEGEPGGGPFWIEEREGGCSRQIVESAQIDPSSAEQKALWASSTHFNPVDLVCAVRDYQGRSFDLTRYADPQAVFITQKSHQGKAIKALELPGLWNGGMADWISLFVEVPSQTFSPVKTINDLLRPEHQNGV